MHHLFWNPSEGIWTQVRSPVHLVLLDMFQFTIFTNQTLRSFSPSWSNLFFILVPSYFQSVWEATPYSQNLVPITAVPHWRLSVLITPRGILYSIHTNHSILFWSSQLKSVLCYSVIRVSKPLPTYCNTSNMFSLMHQLPKPVLMQLENQVNVVNTDFCLVSLTTLDYKNHRSLQNQETIN